MFGPLALALTLAATALPGAPSQRVTRTERFVLEEIVEQGRVPVAVIALRRVPAEGGLLLEQEVLFAASGLRVLIDEFHGQVAQERTPRLVWRELRSSPGVGRTWLAEWDVRTAQVVTANHGTGGPVHGSLPGPEPTWPLALIEGLRAGVEPGRVDTLDPLTRGRCELTVTVHREGTRRVASLRRADGTLAGRYDFEGDTLVSMRLQDGARVARPCDAAEYLRLVESWRVHYDPLGDLLEGMRSRRVRAR